MGHPSIDNRTPFAFEPVYLTDEEARPLLVTVIRATYNIVGRRLEIAEKQAPVCVAGELWGDDAATSSWKLEPEMAFVKPATDVVLIGHAYAPRAGITEMDVGFQVGSVSRSARVVGDRVWVSRGGEVVMSRPKPFERMPLTWERAFGGWDPTAGTPERPEYEPRNPVGMGFRSRSGSFQEGVRLPNIEDPANPIRSWGQVVAPVGFGFTAANWHPRVLLGGTYDEAWMKEQMPLLPRDFDRRFFNAAAPGLVAPGFLRGDEQVAVAGASRFGSLSLRLPGAPRPVCRVVIARREDAIVETRLDTVVVNTDEDRVYLTWRGHVPLRNGPHDVKAIAIEAPGLRWQPQKAAATAR
ncbi:DUF2169 family type VI secretion system accessory protein [Sorangium sp. So ce542]|uniref:DUF2169 family type VI secretion system accessory protein n=1 Tax=Sorangium sp. So ce542 TaxID=3133316 RepID=UPI003F636795